MPNISFITASTGATDAGAAWSYTTTTPTTAGNLIIVHVFQDGTSANDAISITSATNVENLAGTDNVFTALSATGSDVGSAAVGYHYIFIGRALNNSAIVITGANSGADDIYIRSYEFRYVSHGTTLATVIENSTAGSFTTAAGTSASAADASVTTLGNNRLALNFVALADDAMGLVAFTGMTGGTWIFPVSVYETATGTDATLGINTAVMEAPGTIDGGTDSITSIGWGTIGFALIPDDPLLSQSEAAFYEDGTEAGASVIDSGADSITRDVSGGDSNIQLRVRLQETLGEAGDSTDDYRLLYEKNDSGLFVPIGSSAIDGYDISNYSKLEILRSGADTGWGQSFTGNGATIGSVMFQLKKVASPTGNAVAKIYAHSGTFGSSSVPTGTALATSDNFDVATLTTSLALSTLTFSGGNQITLTNGTNYVVTLEYSGGDSNNYIQLTRDTSSPTHAGNNSELFGSWSAVSGDLCFLVLSTASAPVAGFNSASLTDGNATTNRLGSGTGSFVAGKISEDGIADNLAITASNYTELLYSLTIESTSVANADTLDFRVIRNDVGGDVTYAVTPRITISTSSDKTVNKSESITVTESVGRLLESSVNKSDTVTITENVGVEVTSFVSVSDSITISESVGVLLESRVNTSDSIAVTEAVTVFVTPLYVSVSDTVTLTEAIAITIPELFVNTSDNITVTESTQLLETSLVNVSDTVTATELIAVLLGLQVNVSDTITISEAVQALLTSFVAVSDTVTITEAATASIGSAPDLAVSVSDTITATEAVSLLVTSFITVSDAVTITEAVDRQLISTINVSETVTISEAVAGQLISFVTVSDTITITEAAAVNIVAVEDLTVTVSDTVTVTESIERLVTSFVNVSDTVTITEATSQLLVSFITVSDTITVTENIAQLLASHVNVSDTTTITENIVALIPTYLIDVSDTVTITESPSVSIASAGNIVTSANITVSEDVTLLIPTLFVAVSDTVTLSESTSQLLGSFVAVSDTITITELAVTLLTSFVAVSDTVTITENIATVASVTVEVSDTVTVTESAAVFIPVYLVDTSDTVTVTESTTVNIVAVGDLTVTASDSITITESVAASLSINISVSDGVTITESLKLLNELNILVRSNTNTGYNQPTATVSSFLITTPDNGWASDDAYAVLTSAASQVQYGTFNLSVPAGASILGIEAEAEVKSDGTPPGNNDIGVYLSWNGGSSFTTRKSQGFTDTTDTIYTLGAANDTWGRTWAVSELSNANFVVIIDNTQDTNDNYLDRVRIRVTYSASGEPVTITEAVTASIESAAALTITVSDTATITESVNRLLTSFVSVSDTVTVTEAATALIPTYSVNVSDTVTITESVGRLLISFVSASEAVTITESALALMTSFVAVSDTVTASEAVQRLLTSFVNVSDTVTVSEAITVNIVAAGDLTVTVSDTITATESVGRLLTSAINVSDTATVTESIQTLVTSTVNVSDSITVTESIGSLLTSFIAVSDTATISESISLLIPIYLISVSDNVSITESPSISIASSGNIVTSDNIAVSESITLLIPTLFIAVSDTVTISETIGQLLTSAGTVSDTITVTESVNRLLTSFVAVSDTVTITESIATLIPTYLIAVSDTVTITESVAVAIPGGSDLAITVSDTITISESVGLLLEFTYFSPLLAILQSTSTTTTQYMTVNGAGTTGTESVAAQTVTVNSSISKLHVYVATAPGVGKSRSYTLMKNGLATGLTCTISDTATSASDTSNSVSFSAGDTISLRMIPTGTPAAEVSSWFNMVVEATAQPLFGGSAAGTTTITDAHAPQGFWGSGTAVRATGIVAADGTISKLYARLSAAPGSGNSKIFTLHKNGVSTALTATVSDTDTLASDTSNSVSVVAGDRLVIEVTTTGTPTTSSARSSTLFAPTTSGEAILMVVVPDTLASAATEYAPIPGWASWGASEAISHTSRSIPGAWRLKKFYARSTVAAGAGDSWDITVRLNGASTGLTVNLPNTTTVQSVTTNVETAQGDYIGLQEVPNGTPVTTAYLNAGLLLTEILPLEDLLIAVSDTVTISENAQVLIPTYLVNVSEAITVTESVAVSIVAAGVLAITVSDTVTVSETINRLLTSFVAVSDTTTVTESIAATTVLAISVSDTITTTENLAVFLPTYFVTVSNTITVTELTTLTKEDTVQGGYPIRRGSRGTRGGRPTRGSRGVRGRPGVDDSC